MLSERLFRTESITDRIERVHMPGDVFSYIIRGRDRAAVIDTGCGLGPFRRFAEDRLGGMPYDLILTHGHVDHAGGAAEFDRPLLNARDVPIAAAHTEKRVRADYLRRSFREPFSDEDMAAPLREGYCPLEYGQVFDLGGEQLEIIYLGGHTPGSVGVLFREARILLAGDACCSFTLLFGGGASLTVGEYRDNLARARECCRGRVDAMLYSHPHNYGGPEVLTQMIGLCDDILAGRDDRIPSRGLFGPSLLARAVGADGRRLDGGIANLQYTEENL